jgi:multidrug efflux system membrane fusion protein
MSPIETEAPPAEPEAKPAPRLEKGGPEGAAKTPANERRPEEKRDERDEKPPEEPPGRPSGKPRRWPWIVGALALAVVAVIFLTGARKKRAQASADAKTRPKAVSVVTAVARTGDMPVYLTGLGTVTGLNTVTVRSRVDGQLLNVAYREGQNVRKGELLAEIDPRPFEVQLAQAEGQKAKDEAILRNAKLDLERYRVLAAQDAIPKQQLDTQAAAVAQVEALLRTDQGQIDSARLNLAYTRITAPISGRAGLRLVDAGNMVHAADPNGLVVLTQVQPIAVIFTLPEDQLNAVRDRLRQGRKLPVDAFDRGLKRKVGTGELATVDNQIDTATGTVKLKAIFPNADDGLFPNQFVNPRLLIDTLKGVVLVPNAAIQRSTQSTFVFVVKEDQTVDARPVEVLRTEGDVTAVAKGLAAGETVVTEGVDKLQAGTKVEAGKAGAPAPAGRPAPQGKGAAAAARP